MRRVHRSDSGQSSLMDALIFFGIAMIASGILAFAPMPRGNPEGEKMMKMYGETTLDTFLHSTLNHTSYEYDDETVHLDDKVVAELIVENLYLRENTDVDNDSLERGIEEPLNQTLNALTVTQYHYNFTARSSNGTSFSFSSHRLMEDEVVSISQDLHTPDKNETYTSNLRIWIA